MCSFFKFILRFLKFIFPFLKSATCLKYTLFGNIHLAFSEIHFMYVFWNSCHILWNFFSHFWFTSWVFKIHSVFSEIQCTLLKFISQIALISEIHFMLYEIEIVKLKFNLHFQIYNCRFRISFPFFWNTFYASEIQFVNHTSFCNLSYVIKNTNCATKNHCIFSYIQIVLLKFNLNCLKTCEKVVVA